MSILAYEEAIQEFENAADDYATSIINLIKAAKGHTDDDNLENLEDHRKTVIAYAKDYNEQFIFDTKDLSEEEWV